MFRVFSDDQHGQLGNIAETNTFRRGMLENMGIAGSYDRREETPEDGSVDLVIDCVGMGATRAAASAMARPGGVIVHVGLQDNEPGLDTRRLTLQEIGFFGAYCYRHQDFATALDLLTGGKVTGEGWTEIRPLEDGAQAFIDIDQGRAPPKLSSPPADAGTGQCALPCPSAGHVRDNSPSDQIRRPRGDAGSCGGPFGP